MKVESVIYELKTLGVSFLVGMTVSSCKTYVNHVSMVHNNKVLMVDAQTNEERLVDCSKKDANAPNLQADLPYFKAGDELKFKPAKGYTYEGFRAYDIQGSKLDYNKDSVQIRKDREKISEFKKQANAKQKQR